MKELKLEFIPEEDRLLISLILTEFYSRIKQNSDCKLRKLNYSTFKSLDKHRTGMGGFGYKTGDRGFDSMNMAGSMGEPVHGTSESEKHYEKLRMTGTTIDLDVKPETLEHEDLKTYAKML